MTEMIKSPSETARALYAALTAGVHGDALATHFTSDATTTEHPNLIKPNGAQIGLPQMLAGSAAGARLSSRQEYDVQSVVEVGPLAILRVTWTGVIAADVGPFRRGQVLTAHLAQFVTTRDGRVAAIETFDCYEPLG